MLYKNLFGTDKSVFGINDIFVYSIKKGKNKNQSFKKPTIKTDLNTTELNKPPKIISYKKPNPKILNEIRKKGYKIFVKGTKNKRENLVFAMKPPGKGYHEIREFHHDDIIQYDSANKRIRVYNNKLKTPWYTVGKTQNKEKKKVELS